MRLLPSTLILLAFCSYAQNDEPYVARDLTAENLFSTNIEGPNVDRNGNLFVVNFQKDGTIGQVRPDGSHATAAVEIGPIFLNGRHGRSPRLVVFLALQSRQDRASGRGPVAVAFLDELLQGVPHSLEVSDPGLYVGHLRLRLLPNIGS